MMGSLPNYQENYSTNNANKNLENNTYNYALPQEKSKPSNRITAENYNEQFNNYNPNAEFEGREDRQPEELVRVFQENVFKRGGNSIFKIGKHFNLYDKNKSRALDMDEFRKICKEYGSGLSPSEVEILFNSFDYEGQGTISYEEFLRIIRGPMNDRRKNAVLNLFQKLDTKCDGYIDVNDLKLMFSAEDHPDAQGNKKSPDQVYYEFIDSINTYTHTMKKSSNKDRISKEEWLEYYNNVSMSIDKDEYFLSMLNNCWNRKK